MRHTSNLERAIEFAANHLEVRYLLTSVKFYGTWRRKIQHHPRFCGSLLLVWKEWDSEFVESFHLIESSLFESSEERRLAL